jgi:broad specificity phosphatase PhoE
MKPDIIILLRHGESQFKLDINTHQRVPDYAIKLTALGLKQARAAGQAIDAILRHGSAIQFYVSPYWRTRQTYREVAKVLRRHQQKYYEDPRLREQEWGDDYVRANGPRDHAQIERQRDRYGHFYYPLPGGESCANVYDRVSDMVGTMHRDFEKPDFPRNVIVVTHGMTMRVILMRWFHLTVEQFERLGNPVNCEFYLLRRRLLGDKYELVTEPREHQVRHKFQFSES